MFACESALKAEALKAATLHISIHGLYKYIEIKLIQCESDTTEFKRMCWTAGKRRLLKLFACMNNETNQARTECHRDMLSLM